MCPSGCRLGDIRHLRSCMNFNASQTLQKLFTNSSESASSSACVCRGEEFAHRSDILLQLTLLVGSCFYSVSSVSYLKTTKTLSRTIVQNSSAILGPGRFLQLAIPRASLCRTSYRTELCSGESSQPPISTRMALPARLPSGKSTHS